MLFLKNKKVVTLLSCCFLLFVLAFMGCRSERASKLEKQQVKHSSSKTVKGLMQTKPGGPIEDVEVGVHEVPVDLPLVAADSAHLSDTDLVLGIVKDGQAVAFPIKILAMHEVVDSQVGSLPVAPTW